MHQTSQAVIGIQALTGTEGAGGDTKPYGSNSCGLARCAAIFSKPKSQKVNNIQVSGSS